MAIKGIALRQWTMAGVAGLVILSGCNYHEDKGRLEANDRSIQLRLVNARCLRCHVGEKSGGGVNLGDVGILIKTPWKPTGPHDHRAPLFVPGCPEKSLFYLKLKDPRDPMPPLGSGLPQCSAKEMDTVAAWIRSQGKPCAPDQSEPGKPDECLDPPC